MIFLGMNGKNTSLECIVTENEKMEQVTIYASLPNRVPEELRGKAAEYLTRANWGLRNGNFEMDYSDGEVRYKTFVDIEGSQLVPKMVQNLFTANIMTADRYFPGLQKVIYGGMAPEAAITEIEKQ